MSGAWTASDSAGCAARMAAAIIALPLSGSELSDEDAIPYSDAIVWASVAPAREDNAEGSPAHDAEVIWQALQLAKMLELWEADAAASIAAYITLYTGTAEHIWQTDLLARMLDP